MFVDLIDADGKISSRGKLLQKFNLSTVDFLKWYGILHSIPRKWKNIVKDVHDTNIPHANLLISQENIPHAEFFESSVYY